MCPNNILYEAEISNKLAKLQTSPENREQSELMSDLK